MLQAGFTHDKLAGALTVDMNLLVQDYTAPSTIHFSAGANGSILAYVNGATITSGVTGVNSKTEILLVAIPDAGYQVDAWADDASAPNPTNCDTTGGTGPGGRKFCSIIAGNGFLYNVNVSFTGGTGGSPGVIKLVGLDGTETADQVPDRLFLGDKELKSVLQAACVAFGGEVTSEGNVCRGHAGTDASPAECSIINTVGKGTIADGTCDGWYTEKEGPFGPEQDDGGESSFSKALACNLQNKKATSNTGCSSDDTDKCTNGQAVGRNCVSFGAGARVNYAQPANGSLEVFTFGDAVKVESGDMVPGGTALSLRANPGENRIVVAWAGCDGGTGTFANTGEVQSCVTAIGPTATGLSVDYGVTMRLAPTGIDGYPIDWNVDIEGADLPAMGNLCTQFGGSVASSGGIVSCSGVGSASCTIAQSAALGDPTCKERMAIWLACNEVGLLLADDTTCSLDTHCATGYPLGGACSDGETPVSAPPPALSPGLIESLLERGLIQPIDVLRTYDDSVSESGFFFRER